MEAFISTENLIKSAVQKGVNFGKSDPYNRLRYYTKIGWLPHMQRKKIDDEGDVKGHYPTWALERLVLIEKLKKQNVPNDQITKRLNTNTKSQDIWRYLSSPEIKNKLFFYSSLVILGVVVANEMEIIHLGKPKSFLFSSNETQAQIVDKISELDRGTGIIKQNESNTFVSSKYIIPHSKIYVTFTNNYSPATRYWVGERKDFEGFTLELDTKVDQDSEFNWWISN